MDDNARLWQWRQEGFERFRSAFTGPGFRRFICVADVLNRRIVRLRKSYAAEVLCEVH